MEPFASDAALRVALRMRLVVSLLVVGALLGCGAAPAEPERSVALSLSGRFLPASDSADTVTGGVQVERAGLSFESGEALYTRTLHPRRGGEPIAAGGETYSAVALASSGALVELRRVTDQYAPTPERSVCAGHAQYVALVHDPQGGGVVVLVFAGAEPPGPHATESRLCGAYRYTAPDGARTRQGVALW